MPDVVSTSVDPDIVRALGWCRLGSSRSDRPDRDESFYEAERLGLLAHDPIWRATPQGEGVLIALGLLEPTWVQDRVLVTVLWARLPEPDAPAQFVHAWSEGYSDAYSDSFGRECELEKDRWREWPGEGRLWLFWTSTEELPRP
jgi:hypothetical protein